MKNDMYRIALILGITMIFIGGSTITAISGDFKKRTNTDFNNKVELNQKIWGISNLGRSSNGWTTPEIVSTESNDRSFKPSLAIGPDETLHVAWEDDMNYDGSGEDRDIYYKKKQQGGDWTAAELVSIESTKQSYHTSLAVESNGAIHVAWGDYTDYQGSGDDEDIFYKMKPPGGSWTSAELVSPGSDIDSVIPNLAIGPDGTVHVVWEDFYPDVFYSFKPKNGSWSSPEVVSIDNDNMIIDSAFTVDKDGNVHVVWSEDMTNDPYDEGFDICYKIKTSDGIWAETEIIVDETTLSRCSSLATDSSGTVHLAWQEYTSIPPIFEGIYYKTKASGGSWTIAQKIFKRTHQQGHVHSHNLIVSQDGTAHLAWYEDSYDLFGSGDDPDVFYKMKPSGGIWSATEVVSSESIGDSRWPCLAIDTIGTLHVAWDDRTNYSNAGDDWDIFYKKKYPSPSPPDIKGPIIGKILEKNEYTFVSTDPMDSDLSYYIEWGDGSRKNWFGPFDSEEEVTLRHKWIIKGTYTIKAKARNEFGSESDWSTLQVEMPRNRATYNSLFLKFLDHLCLVRQRYF